MIIKFRDTGKAKDYLADNISYWCQTCINNYNIYKSVKALAAAGDVDGIFALYAADRKLELTDSMVRNHANRVYNRKIQDAFAKESEAAIKQKTPKDVLDAVKLVKQAMAVFDDLDDLESYGNDSLAVAWARHLSDYQYLDVESDYDDVTKLHALYTISDKDDRHIINADGFLNKVIPNWQSYFDIHDVENETITLKSHSWFWCIDGDDEDEVSRQYDADLPKEISDKIDYHEALEAY